ncbi:hypothetical protein NDU88_001458 [Pleurodeles waltl]|uniref:Uncharacterized protein n=1 Tax=Pleurodeles waltl TaxID=8319 RepID=A0AAV7MPZ4_PLEWA|nr:hypothetical protein NDU88_001458 [Pleurodeles waltl]
MSHCFPRLESLATCSKPKALSAHRPPGVRLCPSAGRVSTGAPSRAVLLHLALLTFDCQRAPVGPLPSAAYCRARLSPASWYSASASVGLLRPALLFPILDEGLENSPRLQPKRLPRHSPGVLCRLQFPVG